MSSVLAAAVLTATGFCSLTRFPLTSRNTLNHICYGLITFHGGVSLMNGLSCKKKNSWVKLNNFTERIMLSLPFPCFVGQAWINHGYNVAFGFMHPVVSVLPFASRCNAYDGYDGIIAANCLSGIILAFLQRSYPILISTTLYSALYGIVGKSEEENKSETINYLLALFCLVSMAALKMPPKNVQRK